MTAQKKPRPLRNVVKVDRLNPDAPHYEQRWNLQLTCGHFATPPVYWTGGQRRGWSSTTSTKREALPAPSKARCAACRDGGMS